MKDNTNFLDLKSLIYCPSCSKIENQKYIGSTIAIPYIKLYCICKNCSIGYDIIWKKLESKITSQLDPEVAKRM